MLTVLLTAAAAPGQSVYSDLVGTFEQFDQRLPGSANFESGLAAVEEKLRGAGLETHRQTYNTLVPKTKVCRMIVDGKEIGPIYPLGPNGVAVTTTGPEPLTGPLVYLGSGSLAEMKGQPVRGSIALLDLGAPHMDLAFAQGAQAVVFVGNEQASQWQTTRHFTELPFTVPRFYLPHATAEAHGLLTPTGVAGRSASLQAVVVWEDVVAMNLWAEIPGEAGLQFEPGAEEAIVLAAELATSGIVPDYSPQQRGAANAALLAQVAVQLADSKPKRGIFIVFFGSRYAAQDGARHFYYAVNKAETGGRNTDPLDMRQGFYEEELAEIESQIELLNQPNCLALQRHPQQTKVAWKLRQRVDAWVNNLNFDLREIRLAQGRQPDNAALPEKEAELAARKKTWNDMRRQLFQRRIEDAGRESFTYLAGAVLQELHARRRRTEVMLTNNLSFQELSGRFAGKVVVGHFGFDFADDRGAWAFQALGDMSSTVRFPERVHIGGFVGSLAALGRVYDTVARPQWSAQLHRKSLSGFYRTGALSFNRQRSMPSTVPLSLRIVGYQMITVGDRLHNDEMPRRRPVRLDGLTEQMVAYCRALAESPEISLRSTLKPEIFMQELTYTRSGGQSDGRQVVKYARGSAEIEGPATGAILAAGNWYSSSAIPGLSRIAMGRVNGEGFVFIPQVVQRTEVARTAKLPAFDFDDYGRMIRFDNNADSYTGQTRLFYGYGGGFYTPYVPLTFRVLTPPAVLGAKSNATPKYQYLHNFSSHVVFYNGNADNFKYLGNGLALLGADPASTQEPGLPTAPAMMLGLDVVGQSARDYATLNGRRLAVLRSKNIVNDSVEVLHAESESHLGRATAARQAGDIEVAAAHEALALSLGQRAYEPLKAVSNDMVRAVVILLILSIPFAFSMERLLFGSPSIYRQICLFVVIFVATFAVLYVVHPAFSLASAPIVIFLAFMILLMSATVIYIVMSKFRQEIKRLQGLASTVHGAEQESSTALAAVLLGISAMRNRPLKTFLIAVTIILLTFTILVFASFTARTGVVETYMGKGHGPDRIELHSITLHRISSGMIEAIRTTCREQWDVYSRAAIFSSQTSHLVLYNPGNGRTVKLDAVLGLDPAEAGRNDDIAQLMPPAAAGVPVAAEGAAGEAPGAPSDGTAPIYLSELAAGNLELQPGEPVMVSGRRFVFAGTFDKTIMQEMTNLDYTRVIPPDFEATVKEFELGLEHIDTNDYEWSLAEMTAVTDIRALDMHIAEPNFIVLYPRGEVDIAQTAGELAAVFEGPAYAKSTAGTKRYFFTRELEGTSGASEVFVPLLLGGLIIFSSLLGSIVDREREIFAYSALGLAPPDVAALFFAESGVYAVIGGLGGYLFSQVVAKLLAVSAAYGWLRPPEMNFSSLSSTYTILVVMGTVMLSTIYPAIKAGRSANPGVARKWRMPEPKGNLLKFVFPFTVSATDMAGILSFIREHFENHSDASLGNFAAHEVKLFGAAGDGADPGGPAAGIRAEVSLAPFDLGVYQHFALSAQDSDIEGIQEVVIELEKISGSPGVWVRGNRKFIAELRNQFLLWRSLPIETVEHYRRQTDVALGQGTEAS